MEKMADIIERYTPLNESAFLILFLMQRPIHGYQIMLKAKELTNNRVVIGNSMMYGNISRFETDGLIKKIETDGQKKSYQITSLGIKVLEIEKKRIEQLHELIRGE